MTEESEKPEDDPGAAPGEPPAIDFNTFVLSLSTSALIHLGAIPDSEAQVNLPLARQTIDCIALLEEKTKGNLTGEEERLISEILYDLRVRFVSASKSDS